MIDFVTGKETDFDEDIPFSSILIDEKGNIKICFKEGTIAKLDGKYMELNYHEDFLYYYIKKNNIATDEELNEQTDEQNTMKYSKILAKNKYVVILNLDYLVYSFLNIPKDTLIITNKEITKEQLNAIKSINKQLKNIRLYTLDNENDEDIELQYNELIENLNRKISGKIR